jgi:hypothetical protein
MLAASSCQPGMASKTTALRVLNVSRIAALSLLNLAITNQISSQRQLQRQLSSSDASQQVHNRHS